MLQGLSADCRLWENLHHNIAFAIGKPGHGAVLELAIIINVPDALINSAVGNTIGVGIGVMSVLKSIPQECPT
jgi:hypothetical protein